MVTYAGEQTGIGRERQAVHPPNSALPWRLDVANVTTADPGVQVENVSARGRRTRYQRVPGSLSRLLGGGVARLGRGVGRLGAGAERPLDDGLGHLAHGQAAVHRRLLDPPERLRLGQAVLA